MSAPSDPTISLRAFSAELGVSITALQRFRRAGHIPQAAGRGNTTLLAAMRGVITAVRDEAADATPYAAKPTGVPEGAVQIADAEAVVARLTGAFDTALADAVAAVEAEVSALHRPPVAAEAAKRIRKAEGARVELYASRRRTAGLGRQALALAEGWAEK